MSNGKSALIVAHKKPLLNRYNVTLCCLSVLFICVSHSLFQQVSVTQFYDLTMSTIEEKTVQNIVRLPRLDYHASALKSQSEKSGFINRV